MLHLFAVLSAFAQSAEPATPQNEVPPNIVVVVMDDVGVEQIACYDDVNRFTSPYAYAYTPTLDALAAEGARFTQARAAPNCSPSRACLLTGRYGFRTGCGAMVRNVYASSTFLELGNPVPETGLPTILFGPSLAIGKWHLGLDVFDGGTMPDHPREALGFTAWSGVLRNLSGPGEMPPGVPGYFNFLWWEYGIPSQIQGLHATIATRQEASAWTAIAPEPFFLWLPFNAPHEPLTQENSPPAGEHGFGTIQAGHVNTSFRAQLECLDRQLGILLAALPPRTIVFVLGDNGTSPGILRPQLGEPRYPIGHPLHRAGDESAQLYTYPYPPARSKGHVYEGGVHVPLLVWGPGVVAGVRSDLVDAVDLFATLAELRATQVPSGTAQDSVSFAAVLAGGSGSRAFSFSERFEPNGAGQFRTREDRSYIRSAGAHLWKVIRRLGFPDEFYDVASDPLETVDLGTSHPEYQATADALAALLAS